MKIDKIVSGVLHNNTYVLTCGQDVVLIDAAAPLEMLKPYIDGKKVKGILITHAHFDHIYNIKQLLEAFDCKCFMHKNALPKLTSIELNCSYFFEEQIFEVDSKYLQTVKEGDVLKLFEKDISIIELPGHTNCGLGFVIDKCIFCGDTIFSDGYGRTDLATSNVFELRNSINKIYNKYSNYTLYSGHGESSVAGRI